MRRASPALLTAALAAAVALVPGRLAPPAPPAPTAHLVDVTHTNPSWAWAAGAIVSSVSDPVHPTPDMTVTSVAAGHQGWDGGEGI
jgi:hypothetical protein